MSEVKSAAMETEKGDFRRLLINGASRFSFLLEMFLVAVLILLTLMIGGYTLYEIYQFFAGTKESVKAILEILGNLLVLWAMSELLDEEIKRLKGRGFSVRVFITVALAAMIRELLMAAFSRELQIIGIITLTLLCLGIIYFLVAKAESTRQA